MSSSDPQRTAKPRRPNKTAELTACVSHVVELIAERRAANPSDVFVLEPVNPVRIVVAFSGGRDSTALVDILSKLFHKRHQTAIDEITVVHVHHGLSKNADSWVEHARVMCEKWRLPLVVEKVYVNKNAGQGIEAAAREARYKALVKVAKAQKADVIMTGHHQDDRLETFLIQWMRGAGPEGLAAMSPVRPMETAPLSSRLVLARPWIDVPREWIEAYASRAKLTWIEDESNADTRFLRNLIRNEVLPKWDETRPGWRQAAARSIGLVAQSADIMRSVGGEDVESCRAEIPHALVIAKLLMLPLVRQALCLRSWLQSEGVRAPSKVRLLECLRQVRETHTDSRLSIRIDGHEIRRWGANLVLRDVEPTTRDHARDMTIAWDGAQEVGLGLWGGVLKFVPCAPDEDGFDAGKVRAGLLQVKARKGGEKIKLYRLRPSRNLKHLYQAANIPSFERSALPLVWLDGELIFAAGLGAEVRALADKDLVPERIKLVWVPDKPLFGL